MRKTEKDYIEDYRLTGSPEALRHLVKKLQPLIFKTLDKYKAEEIDYFVDDIINDCVIKSIEILQSNKEIRTLKGLCGWVIREEVLASILRNKFVVNLDCTACRTLYTKLSKSYCTRKDIEKLRKEYKFSERTIINIYYLFKNHTKPIDADVYFDEDDQEYYTKDELGSDEYEPSLMIQNSQIDKLYRRMVNFVNHSKQKGLDIEEFFEGNISLKECSQKLGITVGSVFNRYKKGVTRFLSERNIDIYNYI